MKNDVLILGAGPAGIAAGYELAKAGRPFSLVEKNEAVGGLSRTLSYGDFRTDIGGHRFFSQNKSLYRLIEGVLNERWITVKRFSRFYLEGKFFRYPVHLPEALMKMGVARAGAILAEYLIGRLRKIVERRVPVSFEEKVVADFGRTLAELLMLNYTEKIWGLSGAEISAEWVAQRIKNLSLLEIVKNSLRPHPQEGPKTLVNQFSYSQRGIGDIFEALLAEALAVKGNQLFLRSHPVRVRHENGRIQDILVRTAEGMRHFAPGYVVSSIPINELIRLLDPEPPAPIREAAHHLKFRSHLSLFVTLNKPCVSQDQWVYFPEREVPFGRIMEPRNWSRALAPAGKTSLLIEFFCWEHDALWEAHPDKLLAMALPVLEKLRFLERRDILGYFVHRERAAYPVYNLQYKQYADALKGYLGGFPNLLLIGRSGRFRYNNMDHAMETGMCAARSILEGVPVDLDAVGAEQKYFERGNHR